MSDERCEFPGPRTPVQCGEPATIRIRWGCVHEHIGERWSCTGHREAPALCWQCKEAGHDCPMEAMVVTP